MQNKSEHPLMPNNPHKDAIDKIRAAIGPHENTVGTTVELILSGFNGDQQIAAKVDTGAQTSSLHAQDMKVQPDDVTGSSVVEFTFGQYRYKLNAVGYQAVTSADGGTVQRPIVKFNVRFKDEVYQDVEFNLSDRGNMDYPILLGLNFIKQAKIVVDASLSEMEIDFKAPIAGGQGSEVAPTGVEKTIGIDDNLSLDNIEQNFAQWLAANKAKTVGEAFATLFKVSTQAPTQDGQ